MGLLDPQLDDEYRDEDERRRRGGFGTLPGARPRDIPPPSVQDSAPSASAAPRIARPSDGDKTPPLILRGVSPTQDIGFKGSDNDAMPLGSSLLPQRDPDPGMMPRISPRPMAMSNRGIPVNVDTPSGMIPSNPISGDPESLNNKGKPIKPGIDGLWARADNIENKPLRIGAKIGTGALRALDVAGSIVSPGIASSIPGSSLNTRYRELGAQRDQEATADRQYKQAQTANQNADAQAKLHPPETDQAAATLAGTRASTALHQAQTTNALRGPNAPKDSLLEQRQSFADEHGDLFNDKNERTNFVLYGTQPKAATKNPTEWSLRVDAANGDEDAQQVLDQRNRDQRALAGIRHAGNSKQTATEDAANAEQIAAMIMNKSNGDPDAALTQFDQLSPHVEDPQQRRLGPLIRRAIRGRKRINKPQSPIDKILSGDVEGGLNQMQPPQQ